jgi:small conductance mechanosensitive channel
LEVTTGQIKEILLLYGVPVLAAAVVLLVGWWISSRARGLIKRSLEAAKMDKSLAGFLSNLAYFGLLSFFVIAALQKLGVSTASFVTVVGAAGLAIALSLQGSLSNFAAGVMLLIFRPFTVGHYIEGAGESGTVQKIEIFTTTLLTPDNKEVILPNSAVISSAITNYSSTGTRRVDLVVGVGYDDDLKQVRSVLEEIVASEEKILEDPAVTIAVSELGDNSVNFVVRPWVKVEDYWDVYFSLTEKFKLRFDEQGISIPYPQRDVHVIGAASLEN